MPIEIRKLETVYQGYSTLRVATVAGSDGEVFKREIEHHGYASAVLPYDPERRLALIISLPRVPVIWAGGPSELCEAPAGMIDEGEDADACARREALEEAGVRLGALERVAGVFSCPGVSSEQIQLYLAPYSAHDRVSAGGGVDGEQENITVMEVPLHELWARFETGRLTDLKTIALLQALRLRRPDLFGA